MNADQERRAMRRKLAGAPLCQSCQEPLEGGFCSFCDELDGRLRLHGRLHGRREKRRLTTDTLTDDDWEID